MFGIKVFKYLLKIPAIIFIVGFVVLNQQDASLYISPLMDPLTLPLWIMGLVLFGTGFIVGSLLLWLNSWPTRKELKTTKKQLKKSQAELEDLNDDLHDQQIDQLENDKAPSP